MLTQLVHFGVLTCLWNSDKIGIDVIYVFEYEVIV